MKQLRLWGILTIVGVLIGIALGASPPNFDSVDLGTVTIDDASNWVAVGGVIATDGDSISLDFTVGAGGAIAALKVTQTNVREGTHKDAAIDADIATFFDEVVPPAAGVACHQATAGSTFQLRKNAPTAAEYRFYAKKATNDTTLRIRGAVIR